MSYFSSSSKINSTAPIDSIPSPPGDQPAGCWSGRPRQLRDDRDHVCGHVVPVPGSCLVRAFQCLQARQDIGNLDRAAPFAGPCTEGSAWCAHAASPDSLTRMCGRGTLVATAGAAPTIASVPMVTWSTMPTPPPIRTRSPVVTLPEMPTLPTDHAIPPDGHVVTDVHVVVDLGPVADPRGLEGRAVDRGAGADLDIVADHHMTERMDAPEHKIGGIGLPRTEFGRETETVRRRSRH